MKRPRSHGTGEAAERIFEAALPDEWVKRKQRPDYGIDYQVETVAGQELTGVGFAAQVRGVVDDGFLKKPRHRVTTAHLSYYMKQRAPVYLFVVHVPSTTGFWVCLQKYVREDLRDRDWEKQKTITVQLPPTNGLADTDRLTESVREADQMMAELHPAAIPGAIKAERARLEALDPRFAIDVEATEGSTHITFHAKETVPISMTFLGDADRLKDKMHDLLGRGEAVEFAPGEVEASGSPLFSEMLSRGGKLQFASGLRCTVDLETPGCGESQPARVNGIPAKLSGGTAEYRIEAHLPDSPFSLAMAGSLGPESEGSVPRFSVTFQPEAWAGQAVARLAYFDALRALFTARRKAPA